MAQGVQILWPASLKQRSAKASPFLSLTSEQMLPPLTLMYIKAVLAAPPEAYMGIYRWDSQSRAEYPSIAVCIVEVRNYRA